MIEEGNGKGGELGNSGALSLVPPTENHTV
jgi:hypothetical protein